MKRVLAVSLLIFALSFPAFGGHTVSGDAFCECGTPGCIEDYPGECDGNNAATQSSQPLSNSTAELGIVLVALLLWLRMKA